MAFGHPGQNPSDSRRFLAAIGVSPKTGTR
jgi:hypothetical protein